MLHSDVVKLIDNWFVHDRYVFKTYNWFSLDYIIVKRISENEFECDRKVSTSDMGSFNRDEITRLIGSGIFIYLPHERPDQDFRYLRSGGCTCGGYTSSTPSHAPGCKHYKPY